MSKVKMTIEYEGKRTEIESDFILFGAANTDYPYVGMHGGIIGKGDAFSLNRAYITLGKTVSRATIETVYKMSQEEAREYVSDLMPELKESEIVSSETETP